MASRSRSTTTDPTEPGTGAATPSGTPLRRPPPLPAVKGTIGGIESQSPRLAFSPAGSASVPQIRASEPLSPAPSTARDASPLASATTVRGHSSTPSTATAPATAMTFEPVQTAPVLVFKADPRMRTCFDGLPEGGDEVKAVFGI
ncbi:uncharacterized protein EHS24_003876 [Apiotrichum porosum]|uniref:Uncharacterized protein n=1 Tax=Apiotrichum porosum TaxID=105984 RepID=A0A427XDG9_9TREE|nr:uncharacterized protein EHS24_003876 [Apiotrichum porosum]RSH76939.1 hypothetical protein EHS24_003876 [Apiotrichum porosum]